MAFRYGFCNSRKYSKNIGTGQFLSSYFLHLIMELFVIYLYLFLNLNNGLSFSALLQESLRPCDMKCVFGKTLKVKRMQNCVNHIKEPYFFIYCNV